MFEADQIIAPHKGREGGGSLWLKRWQAAARNGGKQHSPRLPQPRPPGGSVCVRHQASKRAGNSLAAAYASALIHEQLVGGAGGSDEGVAAAEREACNGVVYRPVRVLRVKSGWVGGQSKAARTISIRLRSPTSRDHGGLHPLAHARAHMPRVDVLATHGAAWRRPRKGVEQQTAAHCCVCPSH